MNDNSIFEIKKELSELKGELVISVTCKKNKFASQKKAIFDDREIKDISLKSIKEGKLKLISQPDKKISNIPKDNYSNFGTWVFKIVKEKKPLQNKKENATINKNDKKPPRSRRTRKILETNNTK